MRKIAILAAFAVITSAAAVQAQDAGGRGMRGRGGPGGAGGPGAMVDRALLRGITLTDAQKASLEQLHQAELDKMKAEGGRGRQGGGDFEAMRTARQNGDTATVNRLMAEQRAKMDARRDEQIASLRALLTGDQVTTFDANVAEMKKRQADGGPGGFGGGPGGRGRRGGPPKP